MSKTGDHFLTARSSGLFWLAVTILIWGAYMPVGKVVSQAIDPYWITAIRYLFSGLFLTIVVSAVEGPAALVPPRKDVFGLILLGALGSAGFGLFSYLGVRLTRPVPSKSRSGCKLSSVRKLLTTAKRSACSTWLVATGGNSRPPICACSTPSATCWGSPSNGRGSLPPVRNWARWKSATALPARFTTHWRKGFRQSHSN